jgi:aspartyl-tRNA(Asn)/glutamyl-tRNA(Gln) amidotransferase subunit C
VSVTDHDVRHIATLARLGLPEERIPVIVDELNRILEHMQVLTAIPTRPEHLVTGISAGGMPLRTDTGPALPLACPREAVAPVMRDGFFVVPRLATHEDTADPGA